MVTSASSGNKTFLVKLALATGVAMLKQRRMSALHCLTFYRKIVYDDKEGLCKYLVTIVTIKIICAALFVIRGFVLQEKNDDGEDTF